jgi:hypothetical protein
MNVQSVRSLKDTPARGGEPAFEQHWADARGLDCIDASGQINHRFTSLFGKELLYV